jgi:hypothetical protein
MVQIRTGAGITAISGSSSGSTFSHNRSGAYIRSRTKPRNTRSEAQSTARSVFSQLSKKWQTTLTDPDRDSWNTYAAAITVKNKLGEDIHLTGQLMFFRTNQSRLTAGLSLITAAPTLLSLAGEDPTISFTIIGAS